MGRYDQWRGLRGDTDRPELIDAGKKLLGYLAEQRKLSGVKTLFCSRTLADGSVVRARFIGDIPTVEVLAAGSRIAGGVETTVLQGFVTKPRLFSYTPDDEGVDEYGALAQNLLVHNSSGWKTLYFDASYVPGGAQVDGYYEFTPQHNTLFTDGLPEGGAIDWKDLDGAVSVNWAGPPTRAIGSTRYDTKVFHNGRLLWDHQEEVGAGAVIGACLRSFNGTTYLVYASFTPTVTGIVFQRVAVDKEHEGFKWVPDDTPLLRWPRLKAVAGTHEVLHTVASTGVDRRMHVAFNQSATEARFIKQIGLTSAGGGTRFRYDEVIVDLADLDAVTSEVGISVDYDNYETNAVDASLVPNFLNCPRCETNTGTPPPAVPDGTYSYIDASDFTLYPAVFPPPGNPDYLAIPESITNDISRPGSDPFPVVVEYEDDVPVYLYYQAPAYTATANYELSFADSASSTASGYETYVSNVMTDMQRDTARSQVIDRTGTLTVSYTLTDGRLYAVDKNNDIWFDVALTGSAEVSGTADVDYSFTDSSHDDLSTSSYSMSASVSISQATDATGEAVLPRLWFVDLRSRSITCTVWTASSTQSLTFMGSATRSDLTPTTFFLPDVDMHLDVEETNDTDVTYEGVTQVWFYGEVVEEFTGEFTDSTSTPASYTIVADNRWASYAMPQAAGGGIDHILPSRAPDAGDLYAGADAVAAEASWSYPGGSTTGNSLTGDPYFFDTEVDIHQNYPSSFTVEGTFYGPFGEVFDTQGYLQSALFTAWDSDPDTSLVNRVDRGTWIAHGGEWAYSMPDLHIDGTRTDLSVPLYTFGMSSAGDLQALTGERGADLFTPFWPTSRCVFGVRPKTKGAA
jgi:hypothetical protein